MERNELYYHYLDIAKRHVPELLPAEIIESPTKILRKHLVQPSCTVSSTVNSNKRALVSAKQTSVPDIAVSNLNPELNTSHTPDDASDPVYIPPREKLSEVEMRYNSSVESTFSAFQDYLVSPDGGSRANVQQIVGDVKRICNALDVADSFLPLFRPLVFRDKYLMSYCVTKNTKADSIRKYLTSFENFCEFLITDNVVQKGISKENIVHMKNKLKAWKKTYSKSSKEQGQLS